MSDLGAGDRPPRREHRAQLLLQEAVGSGNPELLERALVEAQRDGVRGPEVRRARDALLHIEAQAYAQQVDQAAEEAIWADDCWKMQAAMQRMVSSGIGGEQVGRLAEAMKEQRRRQGTEMEIAQAAAARDATRLRTAIESALKAYAAQADVKGAREMLRALEAQAAAKQMLSDALASKDPAHLKAALGEAMRSGFHQAGPGQLQADPRAPELLSACRGLLGQRTAMRLQQLYEEEDVDGLRHALAEASGQAEKGSKTIADFSHKLARAESRRAGRLGLQEACRAGEALRLAAALQAAEDAGIAEAELGPARQALLQAREREQDAATRGRAAEELRQAASSDDAGRVEKALAAAEAAGHGGPEAAHAREQLRQMRGRTGAERELSEATSSGDVYRIRAALSTARQQGVGEKEMKQAQGELQRLKDQAHARRGLEAAVASADAEFFRRCIEEAKRAGVSRQEIARAEASARELCHTQVGGELSLALASGSLERIRAAARAAADAGVSGAEVDAAWERTRELEAHGWLRRQLAAAAASGDAARLQAAIKQADAGGLSAPEVAAARARLDACHAQLHAQQEQRLARAGGAEPTAADKAAPATVLGAAPARAPTPIANAMRQCTPRGQVWQAPSTVYPGSGVGQHLQPHPPVAVHRAASIDSVATAPHEPTAAAPADRRRAVRWA